MTKTKFFAACLTSFIALTVSLTSHADGPQGIEYHLPSKVTQDFCLAVENSNLEMMKLFLQQGAEINNQDCDWHNGARLTPLMAAETLELNPSVVSDFLLEHGANPNQQLENEWGKGAFADRGGPKTVPITSGNDGYTALMKLVITRFGDEYAFEDAARQGLNSMLGQIQSLFKHGAKIDIEDSDGDTALGWAMSAWARNIDMQGSQLTKSSLFFKMNFLKIIRYLVSSQGANVNHKNKDGTTPLMIAAKRCSVDTVKLLLTLGAKAGLSTPAGDTGLSLAEGSAANSAGESPCDEAVRILQARTPKVKVGIKQAAPYPDGS